MPTTKTAPANRRAAASAPQSKPTRNLKRQPSVSFHVETPQSGEEHDDKIESEDDQDGSEGVSDMLTILQEYKKKKLAKSSSRAAAFETKKKSIRDAAYSHTNEIKTAGAAYIADVHAQIDALQEQEVSPEAAFTEIAALVARRSKGVDAHLETLNYLLATLSPARAEIIEENSTDLQSHAARFATTRKRAMKKARRELHAGMEQQKLATDAQAYIKHYKHLVQN